MEKINFQKQYYLEQTISMVENGRNQISDVDLKAIEKEIRRQDAHFLGPDWARSLDFDVPSLPSTASSQKSSPLVVSIASRNSANNGYATPPSTPTQTSPMKYRKGLNYWSDDHFMSEFATKAKSEASLTPRRRAISENFCGKSTVEEDIDDEIEEVRTLDKPIFRYPKFRELEKNLECGFCKGNNEREEIYKSHPLRVDKIVTCPILRKRVCFLCKATGDKAHTIKYCPFNKVGFYAIDAMQNQDLLSKEREKNIREKHESIKKESIHKLVEMLGGMDIARQNPRNCNLQRRQKLAEAYLKLEEISMNDRSDRLSLPSLKRQYPMQPIEPFRRYGQYHEGDFFERQQIRYSRPNHQES